MDEYKYDSRMNVHFVIYRCLVTMPLLPLEDSGTISNIGTFTCLQALGNNHDEILLFHLLLKSIRYWQVPYMPSICLHVLRTVPPNLPIYWMKPTYGSQMNEVEFKSCSLPCFQQIEADSRAAAYRALGPHKALDMPLWSLRATQSLELQSRHPWIQSTVALTPASCPLHASPASPRCLSNSMCSTGCIAS